MATSLNNGREYPTNLDGTFKGPFAFFPQPPAGLMGERSALTDRLVRLGSPPPLPDIALREALEMVRDTRFWRGPIEKCELAHPEHRRRREQPQNHTGQQREVEEERLLRGAAEVATVDEVEIPEDTV